MPATTATNIVLRLVAVILKHEQSGKHAYCHSVVRCNCSSKTQVSYSMMGEVLVHRTSYKQRYYRSYFIEPVTVLQSDNIVLAIA